jgi:hypothetical protein
MFSAIWWGYGMTSLSKTSNPYSLSDRSAKTGSSRAAGDIIPNPLQTIHISAADIPQASYRQDYLGSLQIRSWWPRASLALRQSRSSQCFYAIHWLNSGADIFNFHPFQREETDYCWLFHLIPWRRRRRLRFHPTLAGQRVEGQRDNLDMNKQSG